MLSSTISIGQGWSAPGWSAGCHLHLNSGIPLFLMHLGIGFSLISRHRPAKLTWAFLDSATCPITFDDLGTSVAYFQGEKGEGRGGGGGTCIARTLVHYSCCRTHGWRQSETRLSRMQTPCYSAASASPSASNPLQLLSPLSDYAYWPFRLPPRGEMP